jgi:hypothetical protein
LSDALAGFVIIATDVLKLRFLAGAQVVTPVTADVGEQEVSSPSAHRRTSSRDMLARVLRRAADML